MTGANDYDYVKTIWRMLGLEELPFMKPKTITKMLPEHVPEVNESVLWAFIAEAMNPSILL